MFTHVYYYESMKRKKVLRKHSSKLSYDAYDHGIFVLVKEDSNVKKESCCCTEPWKCLPSLPLKTRKQKQKIKVFHEGSSTVLCCKMIANLQITHEPFFFLKHNFHIASSWAREFSSYSPWRARARALGSKVHRVREYRARLLQAWTVVCGQHHGLTSQGFEGPSVLGGWPHEDWQDPILGRP